MKPVWNCSLKISGLNVPVQLITAVRKPKPPLEMVDLRNMSNISISRNNKDTQDPIPAEFLGKAFRIEGKLHAVTPELLRSCVPDKNDILNFQNFCYALEIMPVFYESFFYLLPAAENNLNSYSFLYDFLVSSSLAALTQTVFRNNDTFFCLAPFDGFLVLYKLRFIHQFLDVAPPNVIQHPKAADTFTSNFHDYVDSHLIPFDPSLFVADYEENLKSAVIASWNNKI